MRKYVWRCASILVVNLRLVASSVGLRLWCTLLRQSGFGGTGRMSGSGDVGLERDGHKQRLFKVVSGVGCRELRLAGFDRIAG